MNSLVSEIDLINDKLIVGIQDSFKCYGLCKTTTREKETQIFEVKSKDQVIIDDIFKSFFYHKLDKIDLIKDTRNPGKKNTYQANVSIDLVCYSELQGFDEHVLSRLGNVKLLTINSVDYDSQKIIAQETAKKDFDFHKYLFVVNYQILYKTENCYEACL
jgi:hypothetical protein